MSVNCKTTLRTLAADLKVCPATVMRALSGHPSVRPELRQRIIRFAAERGYSLPSHRTGNVAVIIAGMNFSGYLGALLGPLYDELIARELKPYLIPQSVAPHLADCMFDGLISTTWIPGLEKQYPKEHTLPFVALNSMDNRLDNIFMVSSDETAGMNLGISYLFNTGHRRIAFLFSSPAENPSRRERIQAIRHSCMSYNLPCEEFLLVRTQDFSLGRIADRMLELQADALFIVSEGIAAEIYALLHQRGIRIPEDLSIMGLECDDNAFCSNPPLTALRQDFAGLARESVMMLEKQIKGIPVVRNVRLPFQFTERASVRKRNV